jgi:hypothetical protein
LWVFEKKSKLKNRWLWVLEKIKINEPPDQGIRKIKEHSLVGI